MAPGFDDKDAARQHVWDLLQEEKLARFPFPPHGRIPNFDGARQAAERLFELPFWRRVRRIKVNPDSPQRHVRELALRRGVVVFMPTPRLQAGFKRLDPSTIPAGMLGKAATLSHCDRWAVEVPLQTLPEMDAIVCGSVAVTRDGRRCGKGEGYSDLEYAILRELGDPPAPVATTVHDRQVVGSLPQADTDLPLRWVVTPTETIEVDDPPPAPDGIAWERISEEDLEEMPVLADLLRRLDG